MRCQRVASEFFNQPWFLTPEKAAQIEAFLRGRLDGVRADPSVETIRAWQASEARVRERATLAPAMIAVIPIYGVIVQRANRIEESSGVTSLTTLTGAFRAAMAAQEVKTVLFDVNSPGGSVAGIEEFSAELFAARGKKKMVAISNSQMASAAYYLASAADEVVASPSSDTGSIGVISLHLDFSKAAEMEGVKPTWITYGKFKAEGNELEPLGDQAREFWQKRVDDYGEMFVKAVARNRMVPSMEVRQNFGQGRSFGAREAKERGLVDSIASFEKTIQLLQVNNTPLQYARAATSQHREMRHRIRSLA